VLPHAQALGSLSAAEAFGIEKEAWARLVGTSLGALGGAALADPQESAQGAVLGGTLGYLGGAGASRLLHGISGSPSVPPAPNPPPQAPAPAGVAPKPSPGFVERAREAVFGRPVGPSGARSLNILERAGLAGRGVAARLSNFASHFPKVADTSLGLTVPGSPLSVGFRSRDERLPGMHRWVPRRVIERAYEGLDDGLDSADVIDDEQRRGTLVYPALGAGAAAAASHFGLNLPGTATGLAALLGAGAGATFHDATGGNRARDAREALHGVLHERGREFPVRGQRHVTASAPRPALISTGSTD